MKQLIICDGCQCRDCHRRVCTFVTCNCCEDCDARKTSCGGFTADFKSDNKSDVE
ncbi:hypothetical protein [Dendrosporobacter sp. 1207_IL3150]|uniref:hypothetical protein n=1 Tax=Dendrosporobacter sp. 1207_IL3150 TaxID=3084054 RepID=UPI002FDA2511